mmetsp:Transcript_9528/g.16634  ORF Transcript_9528/g.16634 Transcript_9528/m.16634 type:complete len:602 (+) Transcript_9528:26-1831(+)
MGTGASARVGKAEHDALTRGMLTESEAEEASGKILFSDGWLDELKSKVHDLFELEDPEGVSKTLQAYIGRADMDLLEGFEVARNCLAALDVAELISGCINRKMTAGHEFTKTPETFSLAMQLSQIVAAIHEVSQKCNRGHVKRICGANGWALHGLIFEMEDGTRFGQFLENDGRQIDLDDDKEVRNRGGRWERLSEGERVIFVEGHNCTNGYLAYRVRLQTNKSRWIAFESGHEEWKHTYFKYAAPEGEEIEDLILNRGFCEGICSVPFFDWKEDTDVVRSKLKEVAPHILETLAASAEHRGHSESKYALMHAEMLGMDHLDCFKKTRTMIFDQLSVPSYWDTSLMKGMEVSAGTGLSLSKDTDTNFWATVPLSDTEVQVLQSLVDASFRKRYTRDRKGATVPDALLVVKAVRVQNALNWMEYEKALADVKRDLAELKSKGSSVMVSVENLKTADILPKDEKFNLDLDANCAWLFHGTQDAAADAIIKGDFRIDKSGSNAGTLYGRGVYLAESCSKSDEYSAENSQGLRCMLLCRAILGNINYCAEKRPDPNRVAESCVSGPFHSVLGDREKVHNTFREFVVYDDDQVYPEYVFWYRRVYA